MDPDQALKEIRQLISDWNDFVNVEEAVAFAESLTEKLDGLDQWLSKGGFLPTAWRNEA